MTNFLAINLKKWIDDNRHLLKPQVGNQQIWLNREFMVTIVGGPNSRSDYHVNEGEEFFYQVEGDIVLKILDGPIPRDLSIKAGEIFLLPPRVPHSPQRQAGTIGLVMERCRLSHERDGFLWFCDNCGTKLYEEYIHLTDIVKQLPPVFENFFNNSKNSVCKKCGHQVTRENAKPLESSKFNVIV